VAETTLLSRLAEFASAATYDALPEVVRASIRQRMLDTLGVALAALPLETSRAVLEYSASQGGAPQSHALGLGVRLPAAQAAFVNGVLAHSLDYDDTHLPSILHPSASVIPAALAAGEAAGASGPDTLRAVAVGIEITVRLGMAGYDRRLRNSIFFERGQHATSICGTIGAAAAAALLLRAPAAEAMAIAASFASGVLEANRTGGTVKRTHCGWAAHGGVTAAELASRGITGPPTALEGRFGFFQAFLGGQFEPAEITTGLGTHWEVPGIFFKPYPANHFTHCGIDAAIGLRRRGLAAEEVDEMVLGVAAPTVRTVGEPIELKRQPDTPYQAQFSAPFTVASAFLGGGGLGLGLDDFTDERVRDPARILLAGRVSVESHPECDAIYPDQFPAILRAKTTAGDTLVEKVMTNRGGPGRPLSDSELSTKFRENAMRVLREEQAARVEEACSNLESLDSVDSLMALATGGSERMQDRLSHAARAKE
jgi:2-methylcitrate dehydratase PrpD